MIRKDLFVILFIALFVASIHAQTYGSWYLTDSLKETRMYPSSIELSDGNILVTGGSNGKDLNSAEIYDYKNEKWRLTNSMKSSRSEHIMIRLSDSKILTIGGKTNACEIYNPSTELWENTNYKIEHGHSLTLLNDGYVLLVGGFYRLPNTKQVSSRICEIYNPISGKWHDTDSIQIDIAYHSATRLLDGRVLVAGGFSATKKWEVNNCEIFDPTTGKWSDAAPLNIARFRHTATLLLDGKVLVCGGSNQSEEFHNTCELYDPDANTWSLISPLFYGRESHTTIKINDSILLLAGNSPTWEVYDIINFRQLYYGEYPGIPTYIPGTNLNKLPNGKILFSGGGILTPSTWVVTKVCYLFDALKTGINNDSEMPATYSLSQNFPNPFNPSTTIKYSLPSNQFVTIKIFDMLGREVTTLVNEEKPAGNYEVKFNGSSMPSGVYFYRLNSGSFVETKKFILMK